MGGKEREEKRVMKGGCEKGERWERDREIDIENAVAGSNPTAVTSY